MIQSHYSKEAKMIYIIYVAALYFVLTCPIPKFSDGLKMGFLFSYIIFCIVCILPAMVFYAYAFDNPYHAADPMYRLMIAFEIIPFFVIPGIFVLRILAKE